MKLVYLATAFVAISALSISSYAKDSKTVAKAKSAVTAPVAGTQEAPGKTALPATAPIVPSATPVASPSPSPSPVKK